MGCHGAVVLGPQSLKDYLINFARPFIYTTAMSPFSVAQIQSAYGMLEKNQQSLKSLIQYFQSRIQSNHQFANFIASDSAIQSCVISGNKNAKYIADEINEAGFAVKAIRSPTVPKNQERIRICLHSFNTELEIDSLLKKLDQLIKSIQ